MSLALATIALFLLAGILFLVPLVPAFIELGLKRDAQPLDVIQQYGGDIRHFARSFRRLAAELQPKLQECVASRTTVTGKFPNGDEYLLLGASDEMFFVSGAKKDSTWKSVLVAGADLELPDDLTFSKEIYAVNDLTGGERSTYRAILGEKSIHLQRASRVIRWAHAVQRFRADYDCDLYGRISSDQEIQLQPGCIFQRANAPLIKAGFSENVACATETVAEDSDPAACFGSSSALPRRQLCLHDLEIRPGELILGSIVTRGKLHIGTGAHVLGSVKSSDHMTIDSGVRVDGSLISASTMHIGSNCRIGGPVLAEHGMFIESGTRCGATGTPTTVSAPAIEIEEGAFVYGSLWARNEGRVVPKA